MHKHDGPSAVEFLEYGLVSSIPQPLVPVTGEQRNALHLEHTKGIFQELDPGTVSRSDGQAGRRDSCGSPNQIPGKVSERTKRQRGWHAE